MKLKVHTRLKASVTLEAAVIVPLFTLMVVMLIQVAMKCHDRVILNSISDKVCMEMEFSGLMEKEKQQRMEELENQGNEFIRDKMIQMKGTMHMKEDFLHIVTQYSSIDKNNPMTYVRMADAAEKLLKGGKENARQQNH